MPTARRSTSKLPNAVGVMNVKALDDAVRRAVTEASAPLLEEIDDLRHQVLTLTDEVAGQSAVIVAAVEALSASLAPAKGGWTRRLAFWRPRAVEADADDGTGSARSALAAGPAASA